LPRILAILLNMPDLEARLAKAFELAAETVKQLLGLATAVLGVTATFAKDIVPTSTVDAKRTLAAGWIMLLLSLLCGVAALMNMSGQLGSSKVKSPNIYASGVKVFVASQMVIFVLGMSLIVASAWLALP
jgi:hypothetical protein